MLQQAESNLNRKTEEEPVISNGYVIAADIGGTSLRLALADMSGAIVSRWTASTEGIRDPDKVLQQICIGADRFFAQSGVARSALRAIAAGAPGIVDANQGVVLATSYLMGWKDVPLRLMLEEQFGVPASVENDVNLAAIGEYSAGSAHGTHDFVFLAVGTGIGAGIVLNGRLHHGMNWSAGEVGYMLVPGTSTVPVRPHEPGAMEMIAGGAGISLQWQKRWREGLSTLPLDATATAIFDQALQGDSLALEVLNLSVRTLAYAIFNLSIVLNCKLFVLGGTVGLHSAYIAALQAVLEELSTREKLVLVPSSLGVDAQLTGGILLARQTAHAEKESNAACR